jgi:hypothetical protein
LSAARGGDYSRGVAARGRVLRFTAAAVAILGLIAYLLVDRDGHEHFRAAAPAPARPPRDPTSPSRHESPKSAVPVPSPPAAEAPPPVARSVRGRVTDPSGAPLPAADVALVDGDDRLFARAGTDGDGAFEIPDAKLSAVAVIARAKGHQRRAVVLHRSGPDAAAAPVVLALEPAAAIVGRVRLGSGGVPPVPVRVMVRLPLELPPPRWTARDCADAALVDDLRVHTATTDASGDFRIDGLPPELWCHLLAAGQGLATATRNGSDTIEAQAGGAPVEIVVSPLFVFDVRLRGPDGATPSTKRPYFGLPTFVTWTGPYGGQPVFTHANPTLSWTGLSYGESWTPLHVLTAFPVDTDAARIGPFRVTARVPGYAPVSEEIWAVRAVPGQDVSHEVRLGPALTEFGSLRVRIDDRGTGFTAALAESVETDTSFRFAQLALVPDASRGTVVPGVGRLSVSLRDARSGVVEVEGVPVGDYVAKLEMPEAARSVTERKLEVRIDANELREVNVEISEWSALRLDVDVGGSPDAPYRGTLEVSLQSSEMKTPCQWRFGRAPYVVVGVRPGTYDVSISNPAFSAERFTVVLERDRVTSVRRTVTPYRGPWRELR